MLLHHYIPQYPALTCKTEIIAGSMRRKTQTPAFYRSHGTNLAFNFNGARATGAQSTTVHIMGLAVIGRHSLAENLPSKISAILATPRLALISDLMHLGRLGVWGLSVKV